MLPTTADQATASQHSPYARVAAFAVPRSRSICKLPLTLKVIAVLSARSVAVLLGRAPYSDRSVRNTQADRLQNSTNLTAACFLNVTASSADTPSLIGQDGEIAIRCAIWALSLGLTASMAKYDQRMSSKYDSSETSGYRDCRLCRRPAAPARCHTRTSTKLQRPGLTRVKCMCCCCPRSPCWRRFMADVLLTAALHLSSRLLGA